MQLVNMRNGRASRKQLSDMIIPGKVGVAANQRGTEKRGQMLRPYDLKKLLRGRKISHFKMLIIGFRPQLRGFPSNCRFRDNQLQIHGAHETLSFASGPNAHGKHDNTTLNFLSMGKNVEIDIADTSNNKTATIFATHIETYRQSVAMIAMHVRYKTVSKQMRQQKRGIEFPGTYMRSMLCADKPGIGGDRRRVLSI
jgi:hypothetical protein